MKKTGIFYGSTNGDTESVANKIAIQLGIGKEDVHNVADTTPPCRTTLRSIVIRLFDLGSRGNAGRLE